MRTSHCPLKSNSLNNLLLFFKSTHERKDHPGNYPTPMRDIAYLESDGIAAPKLAVDGEIAARDKTSVNISQNLCAKSH